MFYTSSKVISKFVGKYYEIEWDKEQFLVTVISKDKKVQFKFDKYYKAVNFYAKLKTVKAIKEALNPQ